MSRVTIGLAVYNNGKYLSKTLDSILNQSYRNFILLLSDDCSTDETQEICGQYAKLDTRIKYTRNATNLGAIANHQKVLADADTEYFMFARGHEILPPKLVEDCIEILDQDPKVVLAFAKTEWIDEDDNMIPDKHLCYFDTRGCDVVTRCALVFWGKYEYFYGLTRTETMKNIRALEDIVAHDLIMLLEMALLGSFAHINFGVRYRRYYYTENYRKRIKRYHDTTLQKSSFLGRLFPFVILPFYIFWSIFSAKIPFTKKILILFIAVCNAPVKFLISRGKSL